MNYHNIHFNQCKILIIKNTDLLEKKRTNTCSPGSNQSFNFFEDDIRFSKNNILIDENGDKRKLNLFSTKFYAFFYKIAEKVFGYKSISENNLSNSIENAHIFLNRSKEFTFDVLISIDIELKSIDDSRHFNDYFQKYTQELENYKHLKNIIKNKIQTNKKNFTDKVQNDLNTNREISIEYVKKAMFFDKNYCNSESDIDDIIGINFKNFLKNNPALTNLCQDIFLYKIENKQLM